MCWLCDGWKRRSPKSFARRRDAGQGRGDPHTVHVIALALAVAKDIIAQVPPEDLREAVETGAEIDWKGGGENLPDLTRGDRGLVEWVIIHELVAATHGVETAH